MNALKPTLRTTIKILLSKEISQREIERKTGIDRKTIRRYARLCDLSATEGAEDSKSPTFLGVATGSAAPYVQNPPPRPPASEPKLPKHVRSACESHREWIEDQVRRGRNAMAIYQDLVELFGFTHRYNSVKRFVRLLKKRRRSQKSGSPTIQEGCDPLGFDCALCEQFGSHWETHRAISERKT
jgi:hypothetical protein